MKMEIKMIPVKKISPSPFQPRETFDKESIRELAESIKEYGLLQPIVVRPAGDGNYQIVAGERRWRAFQFAGFKEIPAIVKDIDTTRQLIESLIENVQREDLKPLEKGRAIYQIYLAHGIEMPPKELAKTLARIRFKLERPEMYKKSGLEPDEIRVYNVAKKIPLSLDYQYRLLETISVSPEIQKIELEKPKDEDLGYQVLSRLATIEDKELQKEIYQKITAEKLSRDEALKLITTIKKVSEPVRQAMLKPESKITPEIAEIIEKELPDEYEKAKMVEMVERHGLDVEATRIWVQDMKETGRAFKPTFVPEKDHLHKITDLMSKLRNAARNLTVFYESNRENFRYEELKELHRGIEITLDQLIPVYHEVSELVGVKRVKYVKEVDLRRT